MPGVTQRELFREDPAVSAVVLEPMGRCAIEGASFPFERISDIAEAESWRKEIGRPVYHIHKWWAQRLGSVFRAIILGTFAPADADIGELFYSPARIPGATVFDPFMGSGTTVGEALKLGARAIGRDINPVAYFSVRNALALPSRAELLTTFSAIDADVGPQIRALYRTETGDVALYYFWVKQVACPACRVSVDLFSSYIFAQHAYPSRRPDARAVCPRCGEINLIRHDANSVRCTGCSFDFDPGEGPARGQKATCRECGKRFLIAAAARAADRPPGHRMYAKLVLTAAGEKQYLRVTEFDRHLYGEAADALRRTQARYPVVRIEPGYNTDQVLNYSYRHWHEMFNDRQLYALSLLADRIRAIEDVRIRDAFCCLFSGVLEFNNMFASFKGEGTGAVRHMFYHHILKPERTPLEANVWGTPRSSGSFSTLFESRLLRAHTYCQNPSEVQVVSTRGGRTAREKVFNLSEPIFHAAASSFAEFASGRRLYLSCGDSAATDLPDKSVDAVITDPPFFDNVHYSQLADFFFVWQRHILNGNDVQSVVSTRSESEVQHSQADVFTDRLAGVFRECHRVLRDDGLLVFTYHHSRTDGWRCILRALVASGFGVVRVHPVKAEMSVAAPKHLAREPIDLDMIFVCRKRETLEGTDGEAEQLFREAADEARDQLARLRSRDRRVSRNDVRVVLMGQVVARLSRSNGELVLDTLEERVDDAADTLTSKAANSDG